MSDFTEFSGKTLHDAIQDACDYFGVVRAKLEIEIINDAKSGIFGLVGAKKAHIKARRTTLESLGLELPQAKQNAQDQELSAASVQSFVNRRPTAVKERKPLRRSGEDKLVFSGRTGQGSEERLGRSSSMNVEEAGRGNRTTQDEVSEAGVPKNFEVRKPRKVFRDKRPVAAAKVDAPFAETAHEKKKPVLIGNKRRIDTTLPKTDFTPSDARSFEPDDTHDDWIPEAKIHSLSALDSTELEQVVREFVGHLVEPICGRVPLEVNIEERRVRVHVQSGEDSGLLIGRDGLTLSALQYLASCLVSRRMSASVRVQIDAGDYRERQDEKLRNLALELAEKVKESGRPHATRPLSAYQRRIMHMTLQDDIDVQTHSKGQGGMKRVLIVLRRKDGCAFHPEDVIENENSLSERDEPQAQADADRGTESL